MEIHWLSSGPGPRASGPGLRAPPRRRHHGAATTAPHPQLPAGNGRASCLSTNVISNQKQPTWWPGPGVGSRDPGPRGLGPRLGAGAPSPGARGRGRGRGPRPWPAAGARRRRPGAVRRPDPGGPRPGPVAASRGPANPDPGRILWTTHGLLARVDMRSSLGRGKFKKGAAATAAAAP